MLIQYLKEKGYPKSSIDKAVDKLVDYGYVNDESLKKVNENQVKTSSCGEIWTKSEPNRQFTLYAAKSAI